MKVIQFTEITSDVYNLAFGDLNPDTGQVSDTAVSDNRDSEKVLATVVATVYTFCQQHPAAWVYAEGSTYARTRLYQMSLNRFQAEIVEQFDLYGQYAAEWQKFQKDVTYTAFIARLKPFTL